MNNPLIKFKKVKGKPSWELFRPLITTCIVLLTIFGCASASRFQAFDERTMILKQKLATELNIKRLPISVNLVMDDRTKSFSVTKGPKTIAGFLNRVTLPIGQQLMVGIGRSADSLFNKVLDDDPADAKATLKVKLLDFDFDWEYSTVDGWLVKGLSWKEATKIYFNMRMTVAAELVITDGVTAYRKHSTVRHGGWGYPEYFDDGIGGLMSDANATLVALWVRTFVRNIAQNPKVQRFAQSMAVHTPLAEVRPPEITITSPVDRSTTDRGEITLAGSICSDSPIKERRISANGRPLMETRGISVTGKATKVTLNKKISLSLGENVISITAINEAGGTSQKIVRITRLEPALVTAAETGHSGGVGERWAVVVGISKYRHSLKGIPNLTSAANDARAFADFLKSPQGGGFKEKNVLLLTDSQATSAALRRALFTFLKRAIEEDLAIFFFSGQGAPESGDSDNYYLLTYDADPDDLPSTAIPTWDVDIAFRRNVKAKRVLIFVDACRISSIGKFSKIRSIAGRNLINKYLQKLSETGPGKAIFTATRVGELAADTRFKGRKTGLFTHYLLEALSGAADENGDGIITLGETIDYTTDLVSAASRGKQRPDIAGRFDRDLPLAVTKKTM